MRDGPELMDELPESLREATRLLRETPQASPAWRDRVLSEVSAQERPMVQELSRSATRWSFRPASAIAAGLLCAVLGGATVAAVLRGSTENPARVSPARAPATGEAPVRFKFIAPGAARVSVAGDFNAWNPTVLPLRQSADGRTWEVVVQLAPGRYAYAFVVDGKITPDPEAPQAADDDFGTPSSVLLVSGS